jgi:ATP-dependent DNA helicase RecG
VSSILIENLIREGEGEKMEFKKSFNVQVIETLSAFANTCGGIVLIGIADDGVVNGVELTEETLQRWINEIKQKTTPSIIPDCNVQIIYNRDVVIMKVNEYPVKPIAFRGRYYQRVKNSNHQLSPDKIAAIHLQSLQISWDSYPFPNASLMQLSEKKMMEFLREVNNTGRFTIYGVPLMALKKLSLVKDKQPSIAAILLFAEVPERHHIRIGRFKSKSTIIDDRQITDTLFEATAASLKYIQTYIQLEYQFDGSMKRIERWEYPMEAIKETLLNAIVHRDYRASNDVQIKIFDDKLTIYNPGELYGSLTLEQLDGDDYQSSLRNKLIAEAFYLTGKIEKYGTGLLRIRKAMEDYPELSFSLEEVNGGILATFWKKTAQKTAQKTTKELIIDLLLENPTYTIEDIKQLLNKGDGTIKGHLTDLKRKGLIVREGGRKGGYWKVILTRRP